MIKHGLSLLTLSLLAGIGCAASSGDDSSDGTEESNVTEADLEDTFTSTLLAGGCDVKSAGKTLKTKGSGGACPTKLGPLLDALDGTPGKFQSFVVDEEGDQPNAGGHRFVVGAGGDLKSKLFVATVSGDGEVSETGTEVIAFNDKLNAFVYYKEEGGKWERKGDTTQIKANAKGAAPAFECVRCHSTGAPLMKELHDSWANWHSTWFSMPAPKEQSASFKRLFEKKTVADTLEVLIVDATKKHSKGRVDRAKAEGKLNGIMTQLMCEVGEPSIIAVHSKTSNRLGKVNASSSMIPTSHVLNSLFTPPRTGTGSEKGLDNSLGLQIKDLGKVGQGADSTAYSNAIEKNGQTIGGTAGDAMFAQYGPQKSFADLDAIQELLRQNLVDKDIVADVLMTDFTVSSFSDIRCKLASTLPDTWKDADELRSAWGKKLAGSNVRGAKGLAARLADKNDLEKHTAALNTYITACGSRVDSAKGTFTEDVLKILSQRRVEFVEEYEPVVESRWLIPQDKLGSKPHGQRFSATTCELEPQSGKFVGEE